MNKHQTIKRVAPRYKVIKNRKDEYCLKQCEDGDLTEWSEYVALRTALERIVSLALVPPYMIAGEPLDIAIRALGRVP